MNLISAEATRHRIVSHDRYWRRRRPLLRNSVPPPDGNQVSSIDERLTEAATRARITRLFESLRPELMRFALWLARDQTIAEDIVQEALLRAWRSRNALKNPSAARAWLLTIVRREHARHYERKRLNLVPLEADLADTLAAEPRVELFALRHAIMQLPIRYREPLVMQVLGGFSTAEIARELGLSATAVLTRLCRARGKLRVICTPSPAPDAIARTPANGEHTRIRITSNVRAAEQYCAGPSGLLMQSLPPTLQEQA